MKYLNVLFLLGLFVLGYGCQTGMYEPSESDMLTVKEKEEVTAFAKRFLLKSRIKFSPDDRRMILRQKPSISTEYAGYKQGRISLVWDSPDTNTIMVIGKGKFFEQSCYWRVSVIKKENTINKIKK